MHTALDIKEGKIKGINIKKLEKSFANDLKVDISLVHKKFDEDKQKYISAESMHEKLFKNALTECTDEDSKKIIQKGLDHYISTDILKKSESIFNETANKKIELKTNIDEFKKSIDLLLTAS